MSRDRVEVSPGVLTWARTSVGLDEKAAAKRLKVPVERLTEWEEGVVRPTVTQLRRAAHVYGRPLAVLLLPEPPRDFDALRDFRRQPDAALATWSPRLHLAYRRAMMQRDVLVEIQETLGRDEESAERSLLNIADGQPTEEAGQLIREFVGVAAANWTRPDEALRKWIDGAEAADVLVVHARGIPLSEMRGFSISEWPFPVVVLNATDRNRPRLFTLAHELCHIGLRLGGLCDLHEVHVARSQDDQLEKYCNAVAAAALMPVDVVLSNAVIRSASRDAAWTIDELGDLARPFGVSGEAFLLRLISLDRATWDLYAELRPSLVARYEQALRQEAEDMKEREGGPSYYVLKTQELGRGYINAVLDALRSRAISSADASSYLTVKFEHIPKLERVAR